MLDGGCPSIVFQSWDSNGKYGVGPRGTCFVVVYFS